MITAETTEFDVTSTLKPFVADGAIEMTFDETAKYHLMSVMTNMYSDTILACIREYSTNAWDSHVEAGNTDQPIEVDLPSRLNPFFVVRDFGVGMDAEDIRNIYSKYGASTKRGTNEQTGMLGIGCKAALSYAPQFTLVGVKNGVRTQVIISRASDGSGTMMVVDESETDDPNGVTISIPTTESNIFEVKARKFFQHWEVGRVLLDGSDPSQVDNYFEVSDGIFIGPEDEYAEDRGWSLVMGGVSYPIPTDGVEVFSDAVKIIPPNRISVVCHVPIGSITFSPSREGLQLGAPNTIATLSDLEGRLMKGITKTAVNQVEGAGSKLEAAAMVARWSRFFRMRRWDYGHHPHPYWEQIVFEYDGNPVSEFLEAEQGERYITSKRGGILGAHEYTTKVRLFEVDRYVSPLEDISVEISTSTLWVSGFTHKNFTASTKRILKQYAPDAERYVLKDDVPFSADELELLEGSTVVDWETVRKAYKRPTSSSSSTGRISGGAFLVYDPEAEVVRQWKIDEIPDDRSIFWWASDSGMEMHEWCTLLKYALDGSFVVVRLPLNRKAKFLRDVPGAKEVTSKYLIDLGIEDKVRDAIGQDTLDSMKYGRQAHYGADGVDPSRIDDPELRKYYEHQSGPQIKSLTYSDRRALRLLRIIGVDLESNEYHPSKHYPLISGVNYHGVSDHLYDYLNWAYARRQSKNTQP